jgi:hypothetical protein
VHWCVPVTSTNKATEPKQSIEFIQKKDYKTVETLILNIDSNTHLNNKKKLKQWHEFTF